MRIRGSAAFAALSYLFQPVPALAGSSCDFVLHWDERTISACIEEMKHDNWMLGMSVQNLETENHLLRSQLCVVAEEMKRMGSSSELTSLVIEDACADVRAGREEAIGDSA
jgi:hypothetical protein